MVVSVTLGFNAFHIHQTVKGFPKKNDQLLWIIFCLNINLCIHKHSNILKYTNFDTHTCK